MKAWLFPGQGSQTPDMGKWLYQEFSSVRKLFEQANDTLGLFFEKLLFESSESELSLTQNTQPAILLTSYAYTQILKQRGLKPEATSGHSVGEYGALVASDVMDFEDALRVVRKRAEAMQKSSKEQGSMVAVLKRSLEEVKKLSQKFQLEIANFNSPEQVVLSGKTSHVHNMMNSLNQKEKIYFKVLKVSAPFHSSFMKPAKEAMKPVLESLTFKKASCYVVQNFTAKAETDPEILKKNLIEQISSPVLWTSCIETLYNLKITSAIEVGQGNVLKGLVRKIRPKMFVYSFNSLEEFKAFEKELL